MRKDGMTGAPRARRAAAALLLALACAPALASCKPTDFFTEVVISPFAEDVDWGNPEQTVVNSPDAEGESSDLSALDWSEGAGQSAEVQNLVTYSPEPNSALATHHSRFDLEPRFPGALSSDPVRLDFTDRGQVEGESSPDEARDAPDGASSAQGQQAGDSALGSSGSDSDEGEVASDGAERGASPDTGESDSGDAEVPPEDDEPAPEDPSAPEDLSDGYDGDMEVYDPGNAFSEVQKADRVAACGQAAVMVQAIGGAGALAAMDADTFDGAGSACASSFKVVFADELADGFEADAVLWRGDGSSPDDVKDIDALVAACGRDGVIVFDQATGGAQERFSLEQRKKLQAAGIQLVPVDFSTVQGILDAASAVGEALSESEACELDAAKMAARYADDVAAIVGKAAASHGGALAVRDDSESGGGLLTVYNGCPVTATAASHVYTAFGTGYVRNVAYGGNGSHVLDTTGGLLFCRVDGSTPLSFWAQAAGVWDRAADVRTGQSDTYAMLWAIEGGAHFNVSFFSGPQATPLVRCVTEIVLAAADAASNTSRGSYLGNGLGSSEFPYLIVGPTDTMTAAAVKASVVRQMGTRSPVNAYTAMPWSGQSPAIKDSNGNWDYSAIGSTASIEAGSVFLDGGVSLSDTVRENPAGLLGSWTEGSVECALEAAWLARVYSAAPENSPYDAGSRNMGKEDLRELVESFYGTYYYHGRAFDADGAYAAVVTDEGL